LFLLAWDEIDLLTPHPLSAVRETSPSPLGQQADDPAPPEQPTRGRTQPLQSHPNPLRDVRMGEQQPLLQPPSQVEAPSRPSTSTPGTLKFIDVGYDICLDEHVSGSANVSQRPPGPFHPPASCDRRSALSSQPPYHQPALQEQQSRSTPPCDNSDDTTNTLDPGDAESIPKPPNVSYINLRGAMGLDRTPAAQGYYNRIRVRMSLGSSLPADLLGSQGIVRGYMSEGHWMDYANVPEDRKKLLWLKVSR